MRFPLGFVGAYFLRENYTKPTRKPFSRLSPSFRVFYLFAFFVLFSCDFRVGNTPLRRPGIHPINIYSKKRKEIECLVDVVDIVTSAGQQFLDSVAVVALELNRVLLYCSSACKSSLEEFG